jgi:hypothetical protein
MRFHYTALPSCVALLFPFGAVADIPVTQPSWRDDRKPRAMQNEQIQHMPPTEMKQFTDKDFCDGTPIHRTLSCESVLGDVISFYFVYGTTYTMKVQRLTCALDPFSRLIAPDNSILAESDDVNAPLPWLFCDNAANGAPPADPEIRFGVAKEGEYSLRTFPAAGICPPEGGYEYQVKITCEYLHCHLSGGANASGKTWRGPHFDYTANVIYGWYRQGLLIFLRYFRPMLAFTLGSSRSSWDQAAADV